MSYNNFNHLRIKDLLRAGLHHLRRAPGHRVSTQSYRPGRTYDHIFASSNLILSLLRELEFFVLRFSLPHYASYLRHSPQSHCSRYKISNLLLELIPEKQQVRRYCGFV